MNKQMNSTLASLEAIQEFKGERLKAKIDELEKKLVAADLHPQPNLTELYSAAQEIKAASNQIHEVIHSTGMLRILPQIIEPGERISAVALAASGSLGDFDLVTNKRKAEFKFAMWQKGSANGVRKRHIVADFCHLCDDYFRNPSSSIRRELYTLSFDEVHRFLSKSKSRVENQLSKSGKIFGRIENSLSKENIHLVKDLFSYFCEERNIIQVRDISEFL